MYEEIIKMPHHKSIKYPHMPLSERAAQFSPFAALTGYADIIKETARITENKLELNEDALNILNNKFQYIVSNISTKPVITIVFFKPDKRKSGGEYVTVSGKAFKYKEHERCLILEDGTSIPVDDIIDIECSIFDLINDCN